MTLKEFWALIKCTARAIAAFTTLNEEALHGAFADSEAVHVQIDARKGIVR